MKNVDDHWFQTLIATCVLSQAAWEELSEGGFTVLSGSLAQEDFAKVIAAHDAAVRAAHPDDVHLGSTTIRVSDFVNRGADFDPFYLHAPLLAACCRVIGQPFKLSTLHARTVRPHAPAQALHVDFQHDASGWPMIGFIVMIDDFQDENGATRFVPGSHLWPHNSFESNDLAANYEGHRSACGAAGSMLIYNGSVWHGHGANQTAHPRRSIQGAFIRREAQAAVKYRTCIRPDTMSRLGGLAKYLLDVAAD